MDIKKQMFENNMTLNHNGQPLLIKKLLSDEGLTSEVFLGTLEDENQVTQQVAVKVMKTLDIPQAEQFFEKEIDTLAHLMFIERTANEEQRLDLKVSPVFYGKGEYQSRPYFVMEFIAGERILEIIRREGCLPEPQALTAAWHLFRTLDLLHARLEKTYIDLKFENLWWVEPEGRDGQLKLTDLGTLEDIRKGDTARRGVKRDILLSSVYLLGMLTGVMLSYSLGELKEPAEPHLRSADKISWGTKKLLHRLLHRNPEMRPASAAEVARELRNLVAFWARGSDEELLTVARNNLGKAAELPENESDKVRDFATRAKSALDILLQRSPALKDSLVADLAEADRFLFISDYLARGISLFKGAAYPTARDVFRSGKEWSENPPALRRWEYMAVVAESRGTAVVSRLVDPIITALERFNQGDYRHAYERLTALKSELDCDAFTWLEADLNMAVCLDKAGAEMRAGAYDQAANYYRQSKGYLEKLPDAAFIEKYEVGSLYDKIESAERLHAMVGKSKALIEQAVSAAQQLQWDRAESLAEEAMQANRENQGLVHDAFARMAKIAIQNSEYIQAVKFLTSGNRLLPIPWEYAELFNVAVTIKDAEAQLKSRDWNAFLRNINLIHLKSSDDPVITRCVQDLLQRLVTDLQKVAGVNFVGSLINTEILNQVIDCASPETRLKLTQLSERISNQNRSFHEKTIYGMLMQVRGLINLDFQEALQEAVRTMPYSSYYRLLANRKKRLQYVLDVINELESLADSDRQRGEIARLKASARDQFAQVQKEAEEKAAAFEETRQEQRRLLQEQYSRLKQYEAWRQSSREFIQDQNTQGVLTQDWLKQVYQLQEAIFRFNAEIDADDAEVQSLYQWTTRELNRVVPSDWHRLEMENREQAEKARSAMREIREALYNEKLNQAAGLLDIWEIKLRDDQEWRNLKIQLIQISNFNAWLTEKRSVINKGVYNKEVVQAIKSFIDWDIPSIYWEKANLAGYLQSAFDIATNNLKKRMDKLLTNEGATALRAWVELEMVQRRVREKQAVNVSRRGGVQA